MSAPLKVPTCTRLVMDALARADDFMTARQVVDATGLAKCQVSASLIHLRSRKAVGCIEEGGQLWWYATPDTDDRFFARDERTPERARRRRTTGNHGKREPSMFGPRMAVA